MLTVTDQFCGAGGSSLGADSTGLYDVRLAMNHWARAIETHGYNFPKADHACVDVACVDPSWYPTTDVLITSPECKAHSYARGRPKDDLSLFPNDHAAERSRATMWDVPRFAEFHDYRAIVVENVVQAVDWGPKRNPGSQFMAWLQAMVGLGYTYRINCLNSSFFPPTPQSRDRLYVVFWKQGERAPDLDFTPPAWCPCCERVVYAVQAWKPARSKVARTRLERLGVPTGLYGVQYVYACPDCMTRAQPAITPAATVIDWSLPAVKIGERLKPLKPATIARIERGLKRLSDRPMVVPLAHLTRDGRPDGDPARGVDGPLPTQTTRQEQGLVVQVGGNTYERVGQTRAWPTEEPFRAQTATAERALVVSNMQGNVPRHADGEVMGTVTTGNKMALLTPAGGREAEARSTDDPMHAQMTRERLALVVAGRENGVPRDALSQPMQTATTITSLYVLEADGAIVPLRRNGVARELDAPVPTVTAGGNHHALVMRHNGSPGGPLSKQGHTRDASSEPVGAVTTKPGMSLVEAPDAAVLAYNRTAIGRDVLDPLPTATTTDPYALVEREVAVDDCTFRMLEPHEIGGAMAFPTDYVVVGSKRDRVKQYGNAVTPPVMRALLERLAVALD